MIQLHDFLLIMLGVVLSTLVIGSLAYLLHKGERIKGYNEGYLDGWEDCRNQFFEATKTIKQEDQ